MSRTTIVKCDRCDTVMSNNGNRLKYVVTPKREDMPYVEVGIEFTNPGADGDGVDLCPKCRVEVLQEAIALIQVPRLT